MKSYYRGMTPQQANEIRDLYFSRTFKQTEIAAIYKISQGNVSRIISGGVW